MLHVTFLTALALFLTCQARLPGGDQEQTEGDGGEDETEDGGEDEGEPGGTGDGGDAGGGVETTEYYEIAHIRMDTLVPVVNRAYWVRASLKLLLNASELYEHPVLFKGLTTKSCAIRFWKDCTDLISEPQDFSCHCSSKVRIDEKGRGVPVIVYRFYLFIKNIEAKYDGQTIIVALGRICSASQNFKLVKFQQVPGGDVKVCERQKVKLKWVYSKNAPTINRYQVRLIEWTQLEDNTPLNMATLRYDRNQRETVQVAKSFKEKVRVEQDTGSSFFMLALLKPIAENRTVIRIRVSFNKTHRDVVREKENNDVEWVEGKLVVWQSVVDHTAESGKRTKRAADGNPTTGTYENITEVSTEDTTSTTRETTSKPPVTFSSNTDYEEEKDSFGDLVDSVGVIPLIPPDSNVEPSIYLRATLSGSILVRCATNIGFMGQPPVNLSIYARSGGEPQLKTTSRGVNNVRYLPFYAKDTIFSCRLEGDALECLSSNGLPLKIARTNSTGFLSEKIEPFDWFLCLYGLETFIILSVMLWTISNCLHHVHLIMWRDRMIAEENKKKFDENYD